MAVNQADTDGVIDLLDGQLVRTQPQNKNLDEIAGSFYFYRESAVIGSAWYITAALLDLWGVNRMQDRAQYTLINKEGGTRHGVVLSSF